MLVNRIVIAAVIVITALVGPTGTARAGGTWSETVSYKSARDTSLKVLEPEGFKVKVSSAAGDKSSTVPELFALPNADAFVTVTLTSASGDSWTKKVEVKSHRQTELVVKYAPSVSYAGKLANLGYVCGMDYNATVRFDFVRADGTVAKQQTIESRKTADVSIDDGKYDLRAYVASGKDWKLATSGSWSFTKNGWSLAFGCKTVGSKSPEIAAQP